MRSIRLGGHQQPGGVLVEAVHDAGPLDAADARQRRAAVGDQRIDQRAGRVPGGGMHGEALGLVDDDEVRVLVDDGQRDGLRLGHGRLGRRHANGVGLAGFTLRPRSCSTCPSRVTAPARIRACRRERLKAGSRRARNRSSRSPASAALAVTASVPSLHAVALAHGSSKPALIAGPRLTYRRGSPRAPRSSSGQDVSLSR